MHRLIAAMLALVGTASAADYEHMMAMSTTRLPDMTAGPTGTAALLSPDGTRLFHIGSNSTCILDLTDAGTWERTFCENESFPSRPTGPEDMFWSPDGTRLLMPNYADAFFAFRDTDILVVDPNTFAITNLTDDHFEDGLIQPFSGTANFDVTPRWVDEDTIAFLRYVIPEGGMTERSGAVLMTVDTAGGEPVQVTKQLAPDNVIITTLAVTADGQHFAYTIDDRETVKGAGVYIVDRIDGAPRRIATGDAFDQGPTGLAFSADGKYLLMIEPDNTVLHARVVDLETGNTVPVGEGQNVTGVAWSPTGAALAYIVWNGHDADDPGGLFLSPAPGEPGELLVTGHFMPPACCGRQPFAWATNNTILLGRIEDMQTVLEVKLGP
jgi:WD40 repeat protein